MANRDYNEIVRALRAKADSTKFPDEAKALRIKADAIEAKHCAAPQRRPGDPIPSRQVNFNVQGRYMQVDIETFNKLIEDLDLGQFIWDSTHNPLINMHVNVQGGSNNTTSGASDFHTWFTMGAEGV
jgi:hypothetical protein